MFKKTAGKVFEFLKPKPKVNKTTLDTAKSNLAIAIQKGKAANAKLKQTQFEIKNPEFKGKDFTFATTKKKTMSNTEREQKAALRNKESKKAFKAAEGKTKVFKAPENFNKGGRVGLKFGSRKSNVQKIKETFGPKKQLSAKQMKIAKLAGDPKKIDAQDLAKLRGKA